MPTNPVAVEFVRFVLQNLPPDAEFRAIYDAMSRAAAGRKFRNLGHGELAQLGISFSLLANSLWPVKLHLIGLSTLPAGCLYA